MTSTEYGQNGFVRVEHFGDAAEVILNRPEQLNALDGETVLELVSSLKGVVQGGTRAILITGAGRAFCVGASLEKGASEDVDIDGRFATYYQPLARALADLPVPLVTAINGAAAGAGASIALAGDLILAAESSYLMLAFSKIGLVPDMGATWLVARSAGRVRALQMALLGERMSAVEACRCGLVTQVVPDDELRERSQALCTQLAAMPTRALSLIRRQVRAALESTFEQSLQIEQQHQGICAKTRDFKEGLAAFREKRPPLFCGE